MQVFLLNSFFNYLRIHVLDKLSILLKVDRSAEKGQVTKKLKKSNPRIQDFDALMKKRNGKQKGKDKVLRAVE